MTASDRMCTCACGCQIGPDVPDVCVWCRWEPSCVAKRKAAELVLVACLACGDHDHVKDGAPAAAWHLSHACPTVARPEVGAR